MMRRSVAPFLYVAGAFVAGALLTGAAADAGSQSPGSPGSQGVPASGSPTDTESLFGVGRGLELTLDAALSLALQNNLGLKVEDLAADAALYAAQGSWGAFDWNLGATASVTDTEFESESIFGGSTTNSQQLGLDLSRPVATGGTFRARFDTVNTDTDNSFSALPTSTTDTVTLSYVQPLLRGAWRQYATAAQSRADMAWRRALEHQRQVRHKLLLDVSNAYWDLVAGRADVEVAESSLALARTQQEQDQRRLDAGIGTQIDVLSAETQVATREERLLAAQMTARQRADALRRLILPSADAAQWETALIPSTPLPDEASAAGAPPWSAALGTALEHRPELRQQQLLIEERKLLHTERKSETRPNLDLSLSASSKGFSGDSGRAFEEAARYDFPTYQAALSFNFPIGNRTARGGERSAWAELRSANLAYDEIEAQVAGEVREALRQVLYQSLAVRAAAKSLDLARRQLEAEQRRREEGISTNFQVLSFQQDLAMALSSERNARANYAKALSALTTAQGLIGEDVPR
jgi:outer membrane protein TolC